MHSITQFLTDHFSEFSENMSGLDSMVAILIAYLGGVLASLTPCVYPMIPITVSVVGGLDSQRRSWKEVALRSAAYVSGMSVIYSLLGVLAGISGKVFGSFTNNSGWYLGLGVIMTVAALVMLDVLTIDPVVIFDSLKRRWGSLRKTRAPIDPMHRKEMTLVGAFVLGASSGFIAAPCTTPVLASILAYIAKSQSTGLGFLLMLSFSLGLSTLLMTIAFFAGAVQIFPRSGQWMKTVKIGSGLILLAFAEYLIYRAGSFGGS